MTPDLEKDLKNSKIIHEKVNADNGYAEKLYAALCNTEWASNELFERLKYDTWSCSWRYAGGIVAEIRDEDADYMDYYCSGNEGFVADDIREDLKELGWVCVEEHGALGL